MCPDGFDFSRLGVSPKDSTWTDNKWCYRFDVILPSLDTQSIAEEIHRWCSALVAAGYAFEQFSVTCEVLQHHKE
ncbi:MAG: hypothetical protein ACXAB4_14470 [Candidatus Hodarchaeales archaeon]